MTQDSVELNDLERLTPDNIEENDSFNKETLELHLARYLFARENLKGKNILDCACGVGYGTELLSRNASRDMHFTGVDVSKDAIQYANRRYKKDNIEFIIADGTTLHSEIKFDSIVTLETIEHLPDPWAFIENLVSLLSKNGRIIASVPVTPSVDGNPYHLHDFTTKSFCILFSKYGFREIDKLEQVQRFSLSSVTVTRSSRREVDIRKNLFTYYLSNPNAFFKRLYSTVRYGFTNRYTTMVWER